MQDLKLKMSLLVTAVMALQAQAVEAQTALDGFDEALQAEKDAAYLKGREDEKADSGEEKVYTQAEVDAIRADFQTQLDEANASAQALNEKVASLEAALAESAAETEAKVVAAVKAREEEIYELVKAQDDKETADEQDVLSKIKS